MTNDSGRLDQYRHYLGDSEGWGGKPTEATKGILSHSFSKFYEINNDQIL
jgi:hypothetical protein